MAKTMEEYRQEAVERRNEESKRLRAISDYDAESLPTPERYQRMRYLREIEAAEWLENLRRTIPIQKTESAPIKRRKSFATISSKDSWRD